MNFNVTDKINHFNGAIRTHEIFIVFFKPYHNSTALPKVLDI